MEDFFYHFNQVGTFVQGLESSKELTSLLQNFCSFSNFFVNSRTAKEMETKNSASELQNSSLEKAGLLSKGDPFPENRSELRSISNVAFCRDKNIAAETNPPNFSEESFFDACSSFLSSSLASVVNGNKTLLQMAGEYRSQHPGKWIADEEERKKRLGGSSSKIEKINTFLDSYYERQVQLEEEKKEKEERFKWEIPKILLQLTFHTFPKSVYDDELKLYKNLFENHKVFQKEHSEVMQFLPGISSLHRKHNSELHIVITKGKFLLNFLPGEVKQKYDSCKINCYFYPGSTNKEEIDSTEKVYLSFKGTAKWEHAFVLKDFSVTDLETSYVILSVVGKRDGANEIIGKTILAGKKAKIWDEKSCSYREPIQSETAHWTNSVTTPFTTVQSAANLIQPIAKNSGGLIASLSQTFTNVEFKDKA